MSEVKRYRSTDDMRAMNIAFEFGPREDYVLASDYDALRADYKGQYDKADRLETQNEALSQANAALKAELEEAKGANEHLRFGMQNLSEWLHDSKAKLEACQEASQTAQDELMGLRETSRQGAELRDYVMSAPWFDPVKHTGRMAGDVLCEELKAAQAQIVGLQHLCADAYQLAGLVGARVEWLDALSRFEPNDALLPVSFAQLDEFVVLQKQIAGYRAALEKLANEASALRAFEEDVRLAIGNTNFNVLMLRVTEARAALAEKPLGAREEGQT